MTYSRARPFDRGVFCPYQRPKERLPIGLLFIILLISPVIAGHAAIARDSESGSLLQKLRLTVSDFSRRLGIAQPIAVAVVQENPRLSSVQFDEGGSAFYMSFSVDFFSALDDEELRAAVAHEMGHVWIYTHFPYLQTEALANQQALKLVPIESLVKVYRKVWEWNRKPGDLEKVLGTSALRMVSSSPEPALPPHD